MPYTEKAKNFFRARAHGFEPSDPKLQHLSQDKAKELSAEADKTATRPTVKGGQKSGRKQSAQKEALSELIFRHHQRNNRD